MITTGRSKRSRRCLVGTFLALWAAVILCLMSPLPSAAESGVRPAAVAGSFYPADPARLRAAVEILLARARPPQEEPPVVLLVPHAGYVYSGQIAADAWEQAVENGRSAFE